MPDTEKVVVADPEVLDGKILEPPLYSGKDPGLSTRVGSAIDPPEQAPLHSIGGERIEEDESVRNATRLAQHLSEVVIVKMVGYEDAESHIERVVRERQPPSIRNHCVGDRISPGQHLEPTNVGVECDIARRFADLACV